ncbi:conserved hypothetical protein [Vibrio chagasii]|uniref:Uncharacterized protein n=1 Tax=Vibrio coralliirubri TaxID=1516159 RepID=A0AA87C3W3_9VIBR|nr:conserved hypothetical protein [Vibrio chagasii]CDT91006.1 hypothetical protein VCR29J2_80022 [Vibrio coralliirubri]CDU00167.1 hypothetical protein VCR31J2_80022 [Vibrio coralliirubri]
MLEPNTLKMVELFIIGRQFLFVFRKKLVDFELSFLITPFVFFYLDLSEGVGEELCPGVFTTLTSTFKTPNSSSRGTNKRCD